MKFREIVNRVSGFSIPVFGIQWSPVEPEVTKAKRVLAYLEDRRVLYTTGSMEEPDHCVRSVIDIRRFLTDEIGKLDVDSELARNLRAMRAAGRKFLNDVVEQGGEIVVHARHRGHWASWKFYGDLGIMRGIFGLHIALLASSYGLDVEGDWRPFCRR